MNNLNALEILRKIFLEIRLLSSGKNQDESMVQINKLANIAHNIPDFIMSDKVINIDEIKKALREYQKNYPSSGIFSDI